MQRDISPQKITLLPLALGNEFHYYLKCYQLTWVEVARAADVPVLIVWSIDHGLLVESTQAALVREGLKKLTGVSFQGSIPTLRREGNA